MSTELPEYLQVTKVHGHPSWRLAWCELCSDGYRGGRMAAERWAEKHVARWHEDTK